ncbi:MAG: PDZ domain-containing protein [Actinobacteria bacterium]|nr:PDZ domain-containing protein [Actinomycetota bacterium]
MRRLLKYATYAALFVSFGTVLAAVSIPLPYYAVGPGPAREVEPLIHVEGPTVYASAGRLIMTTVEFRQVTAAEAFLAWLDPHRSVVSRDSLYAPGETQAQEQSRSISQMDTSKIDAAFVALQRTDGYPKDHGAGALIEGVAPGCPAEGKLFAGDVITSIDGTPVASQGRAQGLLDAVPTGSPVTFGVRASGKTQDVVITRRVCVDGRPPLFGISMIPNFPFPVSIESGDVGGPSAGLMWALGLYDLLTPGDLTGGRTIAGTGTIEVDGRVGPIGGIQDKVVAAESAGAQVFLCPQGNLKAAKAASDGSMQIVPVATFGNALTLLGAG